ncbi:hypothetical protein E1B28_013548 [Marasmius oreades]|uniref:Uncharacterized protein n=1 Tax=Marasmius oreades TaxID=181124 RepID=A0A9P7RQS7_9AGAR|nr:uncharacterized protein E1B28_013548 [Marasmius oreades]KAG7087595.1 hypothetical protein E1B28_013548 [Marasmius oreades]
MNDGLQLGWANSDRLVLSWKVDSCVYPHRTDELRLLAVLSEEVVMVVKEVKEWVGLGKVPFCVARDECNVEPSVLYLRTVPGKKQIFLLRKTITSEAVPSFEYTPNSVRTR